MSDHYGGRDLLADVFPGPYMRQQAELRRSILDRLAWPPDPTYDERAFQQSGIPDPYALGLL